MVSSVFLLGYPACVARWRRGVGFAPWADALRDARCGEKEWVRALLRRKPFGLGHLPFERLLLFLRHVFDTKPRRTNIGPTGGNRRVATCPADDDEPLFVRRTDGLTFPSLGGWPRAVWDSLPPPPYW